MRGMTHSIRPIQVDEIPPEGAVQVGRAPDGRAIYEITLKRGRNVPKYQTGPDGQILRDEQGEPLRVWTKHPTTAQPVYPRRRLEPYDEKRTFVLENDGQGGLMIVDYRIPTPEELAQIERDRKVAAIGGGLLGAAMVDRFPQLSPEQIVEMLLNGGKSAPAPVAAPAAEEGREWPKYNAGGWAEFSDGTKAQMSREEALRHQDLIDEVNDKDRIE